MNDEIHYKNNPLHGVGLKALLTELVEHYGFEILYAYTNLNCFKQRPSIESSVKFLKKTDWAREKIEAFYLYQFKNLPRASAEQFELSPRDRIIPSDQEPGEPAVLSLEDAARLREKRGRKAANFERSGNTRGSAYASEKSRPRKSDAPAKPFKHDKHDRKDSGSASTPQNPWGNWKS